ncbi:uncharacterized protein LOC141696148 [Apium graveolens]|uniref:uncharacterized protein LOC141696148 n=1 Tax=Apium graveolens TaxID=4045 RepID=UPI003D797CE1
MAHARLWIGRDQPRHPSQPWEPFQMHEQRGYDEGLSLSYLVFNQRNQVEVDHTTMISWMIWKSRNEIVWNQKFMDCSNVVMLALSDLNQWKFVQDRSFSNSLGYMTQEDGLEQWQLPKENRVKVNSDAALFEDPNRYSYAFVVRDHQGTLVEARSWCYEGQTSSTLAAAMGIREALSWIKTARQQNVEVETDSLQIVQWIRSSYNSLSYVGRLLSECKELLAELHSQNVMLRFVKRSANRVAHFLARHSYLPAHRIWRLDNICPDFYHVLCDDLK